jgi:hypothetical protein
MCQVVTLGVLVQYCPTLTEPAPAWTAALAGAALFTYSTLDNMDGKQARRTGSSSPLGLLFDHGCDGLNGRSRRPATPQRTHAIHSGTNARTQKSAHGDRTCL